MFPTLGLRRNPLILTRKFSLKPNFSKYKLKEQPPGFVVGTVNEAYKPPDANELHGSFHWSYERIVALGLVPMTAAPFILGPDFPILDTVFCVSVLIHSHSGFKSCIIDYIPERVYGVWHKIACRMLSLGSFVSLYGIYLLETTENGLFDFIARLWGC